MSTPSPGPESQRRLNYEPVPRLTSLLDEMLWPKLFRGWVLALRPASLGVAAVAVLLIGLVGRIAALWEPKPEPGLKAFFLDDLLHRIGTYIRTLADEVVQLDPRGATEAAWNLVFTLPLYMLREHTVSTLVLGPIVVLVWVVAGGAIARMAACDFSTGQLVPWPQAMAVAVSRWRSLLMAVLGPMALVAVIAAAIVVGGWLGFTSSIIAVAASILYGLAVVASVLAVIVLVGYALGGSMLVPAVVSEGTDGIDGIQRAYAYAFGMPLKLVVYTLVIVVQGAVAYLVLGFIAEQVTRFGIAASTAAVGAKGDAILRIGEYGAPELVGAGSATASRIMLFWKHIPELLVAAYAVSYAFSAPTVLYLLMRQANDGQDIGELWTPGRAEAVTRNTLRAHGVTLGPTPPSTDRDDE